MRYSDALLFAEIRYEGPLKELNNFGVRELPQHHWEQVNCRWSNNRRESDWQRVEFWAYSKFFEWANWAFEVCELLYVKRGFTLLFFMGIRDLESEWIKNLHVCVSNSVLLLFLSTFTNLEREREEREIQESQSNDQRVGVVPIWWIDEMRREGRKRWES